MNTSESEILNNSTISKILEPIKKYLSENNKHGFNFNIFKVINAISDETLVHSAFIAELLDPKGSHGQGDFFLKELLFQIGIHEENFSTSKAFVITEYHIGFLSNDEPTGGRIDILIRDINDNIIAIENKIYASDQEWQLLRYYNNFPNKEKLHLLYLTLDGKDPNTNSIHCSREKQSDNLAYSISKEENHFKTISYQNDILEWLENCVEKLKGKDDEKKNKMYLVNAIQQYIEIVKTLTHQSREINMQKELVDKIVEYPEDLKAILELSDLLPVIKGKIQWLFWETLMDKFESEVQKLDTKLSKEKVENYYKNGERLLQINADITRDKIKINQKEYSIFWKAEVDYNFYIGFFLVDNNNKRKGMINLSNKIDDFFLSAGYKVHKDTNNGVYKYIYDDKYMSRNELDFYSFKSDTIISLIDEEERNILINSIIDIAKREINGVLYFFDKNKENL